jgi:hypothetical protein
MIMMLMKGLVMQTHLVQLIRLTVGRIMVTKHLVKQTLIAHGMTLIVMGVLIFTIAVVTIQQQILVQLGMKTNQPATVIRHALLLLMIALGIIKTAQEQLRLVSIWV